MANAELRQWERRAHSLFDPLWQKKQQQGLKKMDARGAAYDWLAKQMKLSRELCHIGMFDERQCQQVISICQQFYNHKTDTNA